MNKPINREITVKVKGLELDAVLVRDKGPRIAICQDRVALLDSDNNIIGTRDILDMFSSDEVEAAGGNRRSFEAHHSDQDMMNELDHTT